MPQEHHVLRCFSCMVFQVQIVKKAKKWECKMCGSRQSVKRNYGRGSGKDCRKQVMRLNELQVLRDDCANLMGDEETTEGIAEEMPSDESRKENLGKNKAVKSKWMEYLEENCGNDESEDSDLKCLSEKAEKKKRTKKIQSNGVSSKKICRESLSETSLGACHEVNGLSFTEENKETFMGKKKNERKHFLGSEALKETDRKYSGEAKSEFRHTKYTKYLDSDAGNNSATQVNKSSNISGSEFIDLDNILKF